MTTQEQKETVSKNLKRLLDRKGKTQTDMAFELDFPEMTVSNWLKGKTYPRIDKIQKMADYFGVYRSEITEDYPKNLYSVKKMINIPILGEIACGDPILAEENITGYQHEPAETLPSGELFYLKANGESMIPTIPNGSLVMIRRQDDVENGELAAVLVNGDTEATLKRVKKQNGYIILQPENNNFAPMIVDENNPARIIGKAIRMTTNF